jgi:DMSO reductase anchor subunit
MSEWPLIIFTLAIQLAGGVAHFSGNSQFIELCKCYTECHSGLLPELLAGGAKIQ